MDTKELASDPTFEQRRIRQTIQHPTVVYHDRLAVSSPVPRQVQIASPFYKFAHAVEHTHRIPFDVELAVRQSIYGRPGATYLDLPDDIIRGEVDEEASTKR